MIPRLSSNLNIYRRDRRSKNSGGALISIFPKYISELIDVCFPEDIEFICVRVHNHGNPCSDINTYSAHFVLISKVIDLMGPEGTIVV